MTLVIPERLRTIVFLERAVYNIRYVTGVYCEKDWYNPI